MTMMIAKVAVFGIRAQAKVLKAFKRRAMPKQWFKRVASRTLVGTTPIGAMPKLELKQQLKMLAGVGPPAMKGSPAIIPPSHIGKAWTAGKKDTVSQITDTVSKLQPERGKALKSITRTMKPEDRKAVNSIIKAHELDELNIAEKLRTPASMAAFRHAGWEVIFRESNRVAALPKRMKGARKFMKEFRGKGGEVYVMKAVPGFRYGETRLNRSARRRAIDIIARDQEAIFKDPKRLKAYMETVMGG